MRANPRKKADDKLLMALACGASVEAAARECGLSTRTVYRRKLEPAFAQRLQQLRADMVSRTGGMLTAAGGESVKTLLELQKPSVPPATRLGAARATIELGMKVREANELEQRIAALEAAARDTEEQPRRRP
jgi:hypothetical protein